MLIAFRADASSQIGAGHIMRCLSLAQGLKEEGADCLFITKNYLGNQIEYIRDNKHTVEIIPRDADLPRDRRLTVDICRQHGADAVVTDSYDLNEDYLLALKKEMCLLVSIDDLVQIRFPSDIVLNQNFGISEEDYQDKIAPETKLLLGPEYLLLRNEFREKRRTTKDIVPVAKRVLVTMGGGDPHNQTLKVLKGLDGVSGLQIISVIGAGYRYTGELKSYIEHLRQDVELIENCRYMSDLMFAADMAISAGGSTCWELACLGVPGLAIILADNQRIVVDELSKYGSLQNLGWYEEVSEEKIKQTTLDLCSDRQKRNEMSGRGKTLVDGEGVARVVNEILLYLKKKKK